MIDSRSRGEKEGEKKRRRGKYYGEGEEKPRRRERKEYYKNIESVWKDRKWKEEVENMEWWKEQDEKRVQ